MVVRGVVQRVLHISAPGVLRDLFDEVGCLRLRLELIAFWISQVVNGASSGSQNSPSQRTSSHVQLHTFSSSRVKFRHSWPSDSHPSLPAHAAAARATALKRAVLVGSLCTPWIQVSPISPVLGVRLCLCLDCVCVVCVCTQQDAPNVNVTHLLL